VVGGFGVGLIGQNVAASFEGLRMELLGQGGCHRRLAKSLKERGGRRASPFASSGFASSGWAGDSCL
jgi:lactate dehydrogenase-like 2-hydroxyacid dehydrogenase